ncbi:hypothetical protein [Segatella bryantii]|uniref:Uncharacterized protein n=1 Tax=Segatella bryantii TaxID=77095 RepID=A0ABX4EF31_SEGBR|nr:hypothetical protein [Segatella bryantii]OYP53734.1 hypothetical protein CIK91_11265 [Segatella bryantii]UKK75124.1 hypothetical protein L6471_01165 [Segatella bryantii]UKK82004.1 hypothetical protein L6474_12940 [Segatella bryantii]
MKKFFLLLMMLICFSTSFAQTSYGTFTVFPNKKIYGINFKPKLAFGKINANYVLVLKYSSKKAYAVFDEGSVMLLKFEDDSVLKLPINTFVEPQTDYKSEILEITNKVLEHYITYTLFDLDQEAIDRIINKKQNIKKIRVLFTNGNVEDWDIDKKYQPKLIKGLIESYDVVNSVQEIRKEKINNVEAGF